MQCYEYLTTPEAQLFIHTLCRNYYYQIISKKKERSQKLLEIAFDWLDSIANNNSNTIQFHTHFAITILHNKL